MFKYEVTIVRQGGFMVRIFEAWDGEDAWWQGIAYGTVVEVKAL